MKGLNILLPCFLILLLSFDDQSIPEIDIERVRLDIINSPDNQVPVKFISKLKREMFSAMYSERRCYVHVQYKYYLGECFMKQSTAAVYQFQQGKWILKKVLPYYYNMSLLDAKNDVFFSSNEFCEPNGVCSTYSEVNVFNGNEFTPLINYSGFNKQLYYNYRLTWNKSVELKKGDTIAKEYFLSDFKIKSQKDISFSLLRKTIILKSLSDTLNVSTSNKTTVMRIGN